MVIEDIEMNIQLKSYKTHLLIRQSFRPQSIQHIMYHNKKKDKSLLQSHCLRSIIFYGNVIRQIMGFIKESITFNDFANFAQRYKCRVVLLPRHNSYIDMPQLCIKCFYYGLWPTPNQLINILLIYLCELKCIGRNKWCISNST